MTCAQTSGSSFVSVALLKVASPGPASLLTRAETRQLQMTQRTLNLTDCAKAQVSAAFKEPIGHKAALCVFIALRKQLDYNVLTLVQVNNWHTCTAS